MEIRTIQYVLEVAKTGSVSIAAQNLYLSPSNLSYAIKTLEGQLGGELFTRSNRGMALTDLGRQFISHAGPVYHQYLYLEQIYQNTSPAPPAFSVASSPLRFVSNTFIDLYRDRAGDRGFLSFKEAAVEDILDEVERGLADVGVMIFISHWEKTLRRLVRLKSLRYTRLSLEQPHVIVRADHPLVAGRQSVVTLKQLAAYPYVTSYVGAFQYAVGEGGEYVPNPGGHGQILVHNRACLYDMLYSTDAYSVSSNNRNAYHGITTLPLQPLGFHLEIGWVKKEVAELSDIGVDFVDRLQTLLAG